MTAPTTALLSDADWQRANATYFDCHLDRLRLLLQRRTLWLRTRWHVDERGSDPLEAAVLRDEAIDRLFVSERPEESALFYRQDAAARQLGAEIGRVEQDLATRSGALAAAGKPAALDLLVTLFNLNPFERDVVVLCAGAALDAGFARICAYVQDDASLRCATEALAISLVAQDAEEAIAVRSAFAPESTLRRYSLISSGANPGALRVDQRILDYLYGLNHQDEQIADLMQPMPEFPEAPCHGVLAAQLEEWLRNPSSRKRWHGVNLFGPAGSGRRALARSLCERLHLHLFQLDRSRLPQPGLERQQVLRLLAREAVLSQSTLYIEASEPDSSEREARWEDDLVEQMPVFFIVGSRSRVPTNRQLLAAPTPEFDAANRLHLWKRALAAAGASLNGDLGQVAEQFQFPPEMVSQAIRAARVRAHLLGANGNNLAPEDLWEACREQASWRLSQMARPIRPVYEWDDIVLPEEVLRQLQEIAGQVRQRANVYHEWGFGEKLARGRGVSALFSGVSGAGKTMAAEVLANHLHLDLYRIDLAGVVSKYVGETEKNLRKLFDAAERSGAILFFDEADALFGRRTDVKDSHDRFANIEVNYLLQRMEDYRGLSILATNRKNEVDRAFLRRLRFLVDFPFPDAAQRLLIWRKVFPARTPLGDLDYEMLSRMEIAGGNIRNIALAAAFLAAESSEPVEMRHLLHAARREYMKIDKLISDAEFHRRAAQPGRR